MIKIRQSIAAPQFAAQYSSCENGTLLIITFNNPPSNFTLLDLAEHRGHVHILGAVLHTCTCNCCVHTYGLFSKSEQKGHTQMISISGNQSNTHTHWCPCKPKICPSDKVDPLTWSNMWEEASWIASRYEKTLFVTSRGPSQKQTSTWPARHTYPISLGLTFTAY